MVSPLFRPTEGGLVAQITKRLRLFGGVGGKDSAILESPKGFGIVAARDNAHLATNAYMDNNGVWNRYDITKIAALVAPDVTTGTLLFYTAAAGANPIVWVVNSISQASMTALTNARAAGIVVQQQRSRMFGVAGDAVYVNATAGWTVVGAQFKQGPGYNLLATPAGATRRHRYEIVHQTDIGNPSGHNLWLMTGGAPGVGTVRVSHNNLLFTGAPAATYHGLFVSANVAGDPYSGADATWYGQASTGTLRVWAIDCVVEDYVA